MMHGAARRAPPFTRPHLLSHRTNSKVFFFFSTRASSPSPHLRSRATHPPDARSLWDARAALTPILPTPGITSHRARQAAKIAVSAAGFALPPSELEGEEYAAFGPADTGGGGDEGSKASFDGPAVEYDPDKEVDIDLERDLLKVRERESGERKTEEREKEREREREREKER